MMRKLHRRELDFDLTWNYVEENLEWANTLSTQLLKLVDFREGCFFTYFSNEIDLDTVYQFQYSSLSSVINDTEMTPFIIDYVQKNAVSCLFEDTITKPTDPHLETFQKCGLLYGDEVYYLVTRNNLSNDLILECLHTSSAIWHSLSVFTASDFCNQLDRKQSHALTQEMMNDICMKTKVVLIGAYDDEGYIFWEKKLCTGQKIS